MTNNEHRAIELQFYCIIQLLYEIKRDANFLVAMLEGLHFIVDFDVEKIIDYANKFNHDLTWKPYQGEVIGLLAQQTNTPMNALCKAMGVSRTTGYKLAEEFMADPTETIPKVPPDDLPQLQAVIQAYNILRNKVRNNG